MTQKDNKHNEREATTSKPENDLAVQRQDAERVRGGRCIDAL